MLFFNYLHRNGAEGEEKKRKTWRDGTTTHEVLTDKAGRVRETAGAKLLFSQDIVKKKTIHTKKETIHMNVICRFSHIRKNLGTVE